MEKETVSRKTLDDNKGKGIGGRVESEQLIKTSQ
jgi:hypothetical protein